MEKLSTKLEYPKLSYIREHMLDRELWKKHYLVFDTEKIKIECYLSEIVVEYGYVNMMVKVIDSICSSTKIRIPFDNPEYREKVFEKSLFGAMKNVIEIEEHFEIINSDEYNHIEDKLYDVAAKNIFDMQKKVFKKANWESYEDIRQDVECSFPSLPVVKVLKEECIPLKETNDLNNYRTSQEHHLFKNYYDLLLSLIEDEGIRKEMEGEIYA